jgi:hypothetical protein
LWYFVLVQVLLYSTYKLDSWPIVNIFDGINKATCNVFVVRHTSTYSRVNEIILITSSLYDYHYDYTAVSVLVLRSIKSGVSLREKVTINYIIILLNLQQSQIQV